MKKTIRIVLLCALVLICFYANTKAVSAEANMYKVTKYNTFSAVQKDYLNKEMYSYFGFERAYKTMKTKWGNKKALIIRRAGFSAECCETNIFVKHMKKIYRIAHFMGVVHSISKNKKYMFISGASAYFMIYKYSGGRYKKYKYVENNGQVEYDSKEKKLSSKYNVSYSKIIRYTYIHKT